MPEIIEMPKLSDTMTVGTLVKWLKKEGDVVKTGDMLAEVETDKATMELESFFDGTLLKIFAEAGAQVELGAPLCAIGKPGEKVEAPANASAGKEKARATGEKAETPPEETKEPNEVAEPTPAGADTDEKAKTRDKADEPKAPPPSAANDNDESKPAAARKDVASKDSATPSAPREQSGAPPSAAPRLRISPLAKKLAAAKGVDPSSVTGSGPGGRIVQADILAAEKQPAGKASAPRSTPSAAAGPSFLAEGPIQEEKAIPVSNMRGAIARRLVESKTQLPHFYVEIEIDAEPLLALREQLNTALSPDGVKLSVNDFVLKAAAGALRRVPQVNRTWEVTGSGQAQIRQHGAAHVSFAVAIEDGLITPVIRDAQAKTIFDISTEAKALGRLAKDRKLKPEQYTGGTFCVSNLGMMGIPRFTAIINPPNAAILAVGTVVKKPVVKDDRIVVGQTMVLTLSCDHRVVDGALGAQYLGALKQLLEAPSLLLL